MKVDQDMTSSELIKEARLMGFSDNDIRNALKR